MDASFILNMLIYMIIYSFLGWLLESAYISMLQKQLVNSGFLSGPFCPIYGFGAVIMILCLSFLKDKPITLFIVAFLVLSIWEYIVGVLLEKIFKTKYWDYSDQKFNIKGRVCLQNSIYWGLLGVLFIRYIHPFIASKIDLIHFNILLYIAIILYTVILVDTVISIITTVKFDSAIQKLNELNEKIKLTLEEIKLNTSEKLKTENLEKLMRELKLKETRLKLRLYRKAKRLKKAFPTMNSESITTFLNEKIDFTTLKKLIKSKNKE